MDFQLSSNFTPAGDQPQAIRKLIKNIKNKEKYQTLVGVTGSGKTFSMANTIAKINKPTLIISHNKTLAAQLYQEFRDFFPIMLFVTLCLTMIIINQRRISRKAIHILKKRLR